MISITNNNNFKIIIMFSERHPDFRQYQSLIGSVILLEGLVGVGKTTVGYSLEDYLNKIGLKAKFYCEYVNSELLNQYISNMSKYAYCFQLVMLTKRFEIYSEALRFTEQGGIAIVDRSLIGDYTFAMMQYQNGNFTHDEWLVYQNMFRQQQQLAPTCCLFLNCDPEISLNRIKNRGFISEIKGYTLKYINDLLQCYHKNLTELNEVPVIMVDWNDHKTVINNRLLDSDVKLLLNNIML